MAQLDFSTIIGALVLAASNLGAAKLLLTRSLNRQDKMDEKQQEQTKIIAETVATQAQTAATIAGVQKSVEELYASRNAHKEELVAVDTLHELRGCKVLNQGGKNQ